MLCILDGWGHREDASDNGISRANTPFFDKLIATAPHALLATSGLAVGLPEGQMGNSEVGHMNLGGGRVVMQNLPRIDTAIADGSLAKNTDIAATINTLKKNHGVCHVMGLISDGGVHSHYRHVAAMAKIISDAGVPVNIHAFTDGRDTAPSSALDYMTAFEKEIALSDNVSIATVSGRYYAMDRDNRWDRVKLAFDVMVSAQGMQAGTATHAIQKSYDSGKSDEFILPTVIGDYSGMHEGDALVMVNFRSDRVRQILTALLDPAFDGFARKITPAFSCAIGMVEYSAALNPFLNTLFPPQTLDNILGQVIAEAGLKQLRIAETEKYAHVTFFFNGGREDVFPGEERILVPSPNVATYDLQPEMAAAQVTDKLIEAIHSGKFDLIVVNYANTDMVGHTGKLDAVVRAVETIDNCLKRLHEAIMHAGGAMLITADHGNAEQMMDDSGNGPHTAHTSGPVPIILTGKDMDDFTLKDGKLCDVAPTILTLMRIEKPAKMTGESLIT